MMKRPDRKMGCLKTVLIFIVYFEVTSCLQVKEIEKHVKQVSESSYAYTLTLHYETGQDEDSSLDFDDSGSQLIQNNELSRVWKKELPNRQGGFIGELTTELYNITLEKDKYYDDIYDRRLQFKEISFNHEGHVLNSFSIEAKFNRSNEFKGLNTILSTKTLGNGPVWMETPPDTCKFEEASLQTFTWRFYSGGFRKPTINIMLYAVEFGDITKPTLQLMYYPNSYDEKFPFPHAELEYDFEKTHDGMITTVKVVVNIMTSGQYRGWMTLKMRDYDLSSFIQGYEYSHIVVMRPKEEESFYRPGDLYIHFVNDDYVYINSYFGLYCTGHGFDVSEVSLYHNGRKVTNEDLKERRASLTLDDNPALNYKSLSLIFESFLASDVGEYKCNVYGGEGKIVTKTVNVNLYSGER